MFLGQFVHALDNKGRLTIPARFRELLLADGAYVTQGFDRNLMVLTISYFDRILQRVSEMSLTEPNARLLKRLLFSSAGHVEVDKAGRILIPEFLRQLACLREEAIVVGAGEYFEIWSPELWQEQATMLQDADANSQRFSLFNL
jgi:MraZ protein